MKTASDHVIRVKWGVATRLLLAFCGVTLITVLVAFIGNNGLRDSRCMLMTSQNSFDRVSGLLESTTNSLGSTSDAIRNAQAALDTTVSIMKETSNRVNTLNSDELPAVIAIGSIREALTAVAVGERTLLMRQLYNLDIRTEQRTAIKSAFARAESALEGFAAIEPGLAPTKRAAWRDFLDSWKEWVTVHARLMERFDQIDEMLVKRIRGGFEFEDVAKNAFDIAFGEAQSARDQVNHKLDVVVTLISDSTRESARVASNDTQTATEDAIAATESMGNAMTQIEEFKAQMGALNDQVKETTTATKLSIQNADKVLLYFIVFSVFGFIVSVLLALWQTRYLSRPIRDAAEQMRLLSQGKIERNIMSQYDRRSDEIGVLANSVGEMLQSQREDVSVAGEMASGDFSGSVRLRSEEDQLGMALSEMMRITHDALVRVNRHVQQVTEGSKAISTVSQALSVGAVDTASALVEISAHTTEVGEQTHRNAQNAARANEFAKSSREVAERGYAAVEEMGASMHEIQVSSARIAQIVKLIDDIAFQTNLLSLNAAVEAARAGRQGKGFSVVAEEVRNLAARSAKAARETATLVEDTVERIENGAAIATRTDEAFKEILDNAQQTTQLYAEIAAASQEQSKNIDQIVSGLEQIDHSTRQNTRYASQTAEAAQALSRQTAELRQMMVRFQLQGIRPAQRDKAIQMKTPPSSAGLLSLADSQKALKNAFLPTGPKANPKIFRQ